MAAWPSFHRSPSILSHSFPSPFLSLALARNLLQATILLPLCRIANYSLAVNGFKVWSPKQKRNPNHKVPTLLAPLACCAVPVRTPAKCSKHHSRHPQTESVTLVVAHSAPTPRLQSSQVPSQPAQLSKRGRAHMLGHLCNRQFFAPPSSKDVRGGFCYV